MRAQRMRPHSTIDSRFIGHYMSDGIPLPGAYTSSVFSLIRYPGSFSMGRAPFALTIRSNMTRSG